MRRAARVDDNHTQIVAALQRVGASVQSLAMVGSGCPDLAVGFRGANHLLEIKDGSKSPSKRKLTEDQHEWILAWRGKVHIVMSPDEALRAIGAFK